MHISQDTTTGKVTVTAEAVGGRVEIPIAKTGKFQLHFYSPEKETVLILVDYQTLENIQKSIQIIKNFWETEVITEKENM